MPTLIQGAHSAKHSEFWALFFYQNLGLWISFGVMILLGRYEEAIHI